MKMKNNLEEKTIKEVLERMLKSKTKQHNLSAINLIIKDYENKFDLSEHKKTYETLKSKYEK